MTQHLSNSDLEAIEAGTQTLATVAASSGLAERDLEAALVGFRLARAEARARRRRWVVALQGAAAAAIVFTAAHAASQASCAAPPGWNPLLRVMCPNAPALAEDVNANFQRVHDWLAQRTGALDAGVQLTAPTLTSATVTGTLAAGGLTTTGPVSFGAAGFDGGVTVNNVLRAQALQTTLLRHQPGGTLTLSATTAYQSAGLTLTFTLDQPTVVDFRYVVSGSLTGVGGVGFARLMLSTVGELSDARSFGDSPVIFTGSALRQLAPGTYTATVELFLTPGATFTSDSSSTSFARALSVHVMGVAR